jgi:hypothetical protein
MPAAAKNIAYVTSWSQGHLFETAVAGLAVTAWSSLAAIPAA